MKVEIIKGQHTDKALKNCYHYILEVYRKESQHDSDLCKGIDRGPIERIQHRGAT